MPTPQLHTQTLPQPKREGYTVSYFYKGTVHRMADGSLVREFVTGLRKRRFTLDFIHLTSAQKTTVDTALGYVEDGTSRTFIAPDTGSYTVVLAENGEPKWSVVSGVGSQFFYSGTLVLEEV